MKKYHPMPWYKRIWDYLVTEKRMIDAGRKLKKPRNVPRGLDKFLYRVLRKLLNRVAVIKKWRRLRRKALGRAKRRALVRALRLSWPFGKLFLYWKGIQFVYDRLKWQLLGKAKFRKWGRELNSTAENVFTTVRFQVNQKFQKTIDTYHAWSKATFLEVLVKRAKEIASRVRFGNKNNKGKMVGGMVKGKVLRDIAGERGRARADALQVLAGPKLRVAAVLVNKYSRGERSMITSKYPNSGGGKWLAFTNNSKVRNFQWKAAERKKPKKGEKVGDLYKGARGKTPQQRLFEAADEFIKKNKKPRKFRMLWHLLGGQYQRVESMFKAAGRFKGVSSGGFIDIRKEEQNWRAIRVKGWLKTSSRTTISGSEFKPYIKSVEDYGLSGDIDKRLRLMMDDLYNKEMKRDDNSMQAHMDAKSKKLNQTLK